VPSKAALVDESAEFDYADDFDDDGRDGTARAPS
jgi:DNA excision repair protein ERCC-3